MKGKEIPQQEAEHSKWMGGNFFFQLQKGNFFIYIYIYTHTHIHTYIYTYIHTHIYIFMCIYMYIYIFFFNWRLLIEDFSVLWWFLPYIQLNQPWMYMCYQQENLHTRLVLSGHTTSSSPCLPVRILSLYGEFNGAQPNVLSI